MKAEVLSNVGGVVEVKVRGKRTPNALWGTHRDLNRGDIVNVRFVAQQQYVMLKSAKK